MHKQRCPSNNQVLYFLSLALPLLRNQACEIGLVSGHTIRNCATGACEIGEVVGRRGLAMLLRHSLSATHWQQFGYTD